MGPLATPLTICALERRVASHPPRHPPGSPLRLPAPAAPIRISNYKCCVTSSLRLFFWCRCYRHQNRHQPAPEPEPPPQRHQGPRGGSVFASGDGLEDRQTKRFSTGWYYALPSSFSSHLAESHATRRQRRPRTTPARPPPLRRWHGASQFRGSSAQCRVQAVHPVSSTAAAPSRSSPARRHAALWRAATTQTTVAPDTELNRWQAAPSSRPTTWTSYA